MHLSIWLRCIIKTAKKEAKNKDCSQLFPSTIHIPRVVIVVMWKEISGILATCNPWQAHPIMPKDKETQDIEVQTLSSDWFRG